ncbi:MAG: hypothetical protein ABJI96_08975 [Paracoccaceae bacterium]
MKKLRISAPTLADLRAFLAGTDLDLGCRPAARKTNERFETFAFGEREELGRLRARRSGGIEVDDLGDLAPQATRIQMVATGNRFADGQLPRGFGRKE